MAQWRVNKCATAQELEQLVESTASDTSTRYYAAQKLVALDDRKRNTRLAKTSSMSFERFLKEHHSKHKMDWKNRETRDTRQELTRAAGADALFPALAARTALPRFAESATSKSAQIARELLRHDAVRAMDDDDDADNKYEYSEDPGLGEVAESSSEGDDDDDHERHTGTKTKLRAKQQRRVSLDEAFGVREALDQLQRADFPPTEEEANAMRRNRAKRRLESRNKLLASSALDDVVYEDDHFSPGIAFWRNIPCTDPALTRGGFAPDTLVVEPGQQACVLVLDTAVLGASAAGHGEKSTSERFVIARETLAKPAFQDVFLHRARKTRRPRGQPLYVVKYGNSKRADLLFSVQDVQDVLTKLSRSGASPKSGGDVSDAAQSDCKADSDDSCNGSVCVQRFVRPSGRRPWLVRLIHSNRGTTQVFTATARHDVPAPTDDPSNPAVAARWLVDTRRNRGANAAPATEIVYGGAKKDAPGTFGRPCEIAQAVLNDIARHTGARFEKMSFEFLRTQSGAWYLVNVRGFGGLQRPKALGAVRNIALYPCDATTTALDAVEACCGDYCATLGRLRKTDGRHRRVFQKTIDDDRATSAVEDSPTQSDHPGDRVPVCAACAKVYKTRQQGLEMTMLLQTAATSQESASDANDGPLSAEDVSDCPRQQGASCEDGASDAQHDEDAQSDASSLPRRRSLARQASGSAVPYSSDMLKQNRSIYEQMIAKQRKHIAVARREEMTMEEQIEDKLLASPTEDFALF